MTCPQLTAADIARVKAPPGTYWRGPVLWARMQVRGREHRFSLRTSDPTVAIARMEDEKRKLVDGAYFAAPGLTDSLSTSEGLCRWVQRQGRLVGFIYFVEAAGFIKIGYANDWQSRLASLQTGNRHSLRRLAVIAGSRAALHRKFAHLRSRGEWFSSASDLLAYIEAAKVRGRCLRAGEG